MRAEEVDHKVKISISNDTTKRWRLRHDDSILLIPLLLYFGRIIRNVWPLSVFIYIIGYLIYNIAFLSYGTVNIPVLKANFIFTGSTFITISLFLPTLGVLYSVVEDVNLIRGDKVQTIPITYLTGVMYFLVIAFYVLFVTREDFNNSVFGIRLITLFFIFVVSVLLGMIFVAKASNKLSDLEKRILEGDRDLEEDNGLAKLREKKSSKVLFILLKGFNLLLFVYSLILGVILLGEIPWFVKKVLFSLKSWFYPISLFLTVVTLMRLRNVIKEIKDKGSEKKLTKVSKTVERLIVVGYVFVIFLAFLTIISYSLTIFKLIPRSRGGMMPLYKTVFYLKKDKAEFYRSLLDKHSNGSSGNKTIPLYIILSTNDSYYVIRNYTYTAEEKQIWIMRKKDVVAEKRVRANPLYEQEK